ncbi:MAG: hypothetical protein HY219_01185 [Candidatus Staskawiczbacteria bacterium]|nr:hypothetical protein [Candidatus Staskawiczbacteria bacterium]
MSQTRQKVLLFLLGGLAFGYSYTPNRQWKVIKEISYQWKRINREELQKEINILYRSKLINKKYNPDGSCSIFLTEKGKIKTLKYKFSEMKIENKKWDGKWRIVVFDIPEKIRRGRDALRWKIKELGFYELQKSVFVFPYECKNEINFIIEFFNLRQYARYGVLESIDNDKHLKKLFDIN